MSTAVLLAVFATGLFAGAVLALGIAFLVRRDRRGEGDAAAARLSELLAPLRTELERYDSRLATFDRDRAIQFGALATRPDLVAAASDGLRDQTQQLASALRCRTCVDAGARCSSSAWSSWRAWPSTATSRRSAAKRTGSSSAPAPRRSSSCSFCPGEAFFSAALEHDAALLDESAARGVILATPTTLIALLRAAAFGWREARMAERAREISTLCATLYDRLATLGSHMSEVGVSLDRAVTSYNRAIGSLEGRVMVSARRFKELVVPE